MSREKLLPATKLGPAIGVSRWTIQAMKKAGLVFSHGSRCVPSCAMKWLEDHPEFRTTQAYPRPARPEGKTETAAARATASAGKLGARS